MASTEDPKGEQSPTGQPLSPQGPAGGGLEHPQASDSSYHYYDESYTYDSASTSQPPPVVPPVPPPVPPPVVPEFVAPFQPMSALPAAGGSGKKPPKDPPPEDDEEEDGMLRMSFLGHLEELRKRIFLMLIGVALAFVLSLTFCEELWGIVSAPAREALISLKINPPNLVAITPMEAFNVIWFKLPTLVAIFLSSPWILYQVWAFISPGLYKKERGFAIPFVLSTAGLFISGGCFAYFVAFRFGLTFLLGIGRYQGVTPMVSIDEYFNMFVNVTLGIAVVFELPILIFFLTLLRVTTPKFLIANSRYAILAIVILAAVITPTPDIFNLMLFATPMCLLFYIGIFASWLLVLNRENRKFPWKVTLLITLVILLLLAALVYVALTKYHYHFVAHLPFFTK